MNNRAYNAIIFIISMTAFLALVYWSVPWWAYLLYFILVFELN